MGSPALQGLAAGDLSRLDHPLDAGAGVGPGVAAAVDGDLPALLSSLVLPHPRLRVRRIGRPTERPPGAVRRQSHLLSRHHRARLADRRLLHRQARGRELAAVRLARAAAALGVHRPPGAQHRAAARRIAGRLAAKEALILFPGGHQRRRQPRSAVQERAVQRRRPRGNGRRDGAARVDRLHQARRHADRAPASGRSSPGTATWRWRRICGRCSASARSRSSSNSIPRRRWPIAARARRSARYCEARVAGGLASALSGRPAAARAPPKRRAGHERRLAAAAEAASPGAGMTRHSRCHHRCP